MQQPFLKIENIWHSYGTWPRTPWTLSSVDLSLQKGELVGLLGPSGCGKTTLLRLIAGFERPSRGTIFLDGNPIANSVNVLPPELRAVGMVFQDYALFPHLNAWRNVCFGLRRGEDTCRAEWLFELLDLVPFRQRYPHELSGGQRQRLALARALAPGTSLVLLDEPFSNLDVEVRLRLRSQLPRILQTCGATGLLVTHDPQEALAICDRVAVLRSGELHQCAPPCELVDQPATPFVGRFVLQRNIIPLDTSGDIWSTPIGSIERLNDIPINEASQLMVDDQVIQVRPHPSGEALIQSREFQGTHWILSISIGDHVLRVRQPLEELVNTGDRCFLNFKPGGSGIIFPGAIPCTL